MTPDKKPPNRIISLRKAVYEFVKNHDDLEGNSEIQDLLVALDVAALEYLEER